VVENPIINRIAFEGNNKLDDKDLNSEIQLRPRVVYTRTRVQNDVKRILDLYRRHGHFAATVEPKVIQLSENRVDLVFEINEGVKTGVKLIQFAGNRFYSAYRLKEVIKTAQTGLLAFLQTTDIYDPDRIEADRELVKKISGLMQQFMANLELIVEARLDSDITLMIRRMNQQGDHTHDWDPQVTDDGVPTTLAEMRSKDFAHLMENLDGYLCGLSSALIPRPHAA